MVDVLYDLYFMFCNNCRILEKLKINSIFRHSIRIVSNILVPIWFRITETNPNYRIGETEKLEGRLIVSLTSFPARINKLWIVIESILRQTHKPDMLILWLSKEQFSSINELPSNLKKLQKRGLKICLCDGDIRSHKKYYYVLRDYPKDHLFTLDDDLIYPTNTISSVMSEAKLHPGCIVGRYSHQISLDEKGNVCIGKIKNHNVAGRALWTTFVGTGGGVFFPSGTLPDITLDKDTFMSICRNADDVWLNSMCRFSKHKVVAVMNKCPLLEIINKNNIRLASVNCGEGNYLQLIAVRDFCIKNGIDPFESLKNN